MEKEDVKLEVTLLYSMVIIMAMDIFERISKIFDTRDIIKVSEFLKEFEECINPEVFLETLFKEGIVGIENDEVELLEDRELSTETLRGAIFAWLLFNKLEMDSEEDNRKRSRNGDSEDED